MPLVESNTTVAELAEMIRQETGWDGQELYRPVLDVILRVIDAASGDYCVKGEFDDMEPRRLHAARIIEAFREAASLASQINAGYDPRLSN